MISRVRSRRAETGFTLLEVIIVVVVLGLVMGLVLSHGPMRSRTLEARSVAADVARMLRAARGQAIQGNRPVNVVVDLRRRQIAVDGGPVRTVPPGIGLSVVASVPQTKGKTFAAFRFEPDGSASGGRIELAEDRLRIEVGVDWLTGRVRVVDAPAT